MAKPNLALIPATIGDKVYSILPSDGVGDFDFDRADGSSPTGVTRINAQGLIEQVASGVNRLNYSLLDGEVVGCPHLLLEPARTNLVQYSEDFSNAAWTKSNSSITSNSVISPDGTLNADKLVVSTSSGYISGTFISSGNTDVTVSFFVKSDTLSNFNFTEAFYFGTITNFDLSNGTTDNGKIENYGNGWYRCSKTYTYASGQQIVAIQIKTGATGSLYIFGGQYEEGSYPTSYIKSNSGGATTRAAETCDGSGNAATFNDSEGVLMAEISALADISSLRTITIGDKSSSNAISIRIDNANQIVAYVNVGGVNQCAITASVPTSLFNKCLIKYKANDFSAWVNGFKIGVDTSGIVFPSGTLNRLNFDIGYGSVSPFYGNTKQLQYFDSALTDTELEQLTSWDSFRAMAEGQLYTIE